MLIELHRSPFFCDRRILTITWDANNYNVLYSYVQWIYWKLKRASQFEMESVVGRSLLHRIHKVKVKISNVRMVNTFSLLTNCEKQFCNVFCKPFSDQHRKQDAWVKALDMISNKICESREWVQTYLMDNHVIILPKPIKEIAFQIFVDN